ncbi:uncharacterized protein LOC129908664 [Episyrphus balteatus]|uniref:uncharacterized protein LOC129908664 n=1 Tax=Episyrphus balteatus TaxID=286459 RepID=UPI00248513A7|nr:uncharacterized protein LOC129908664 [Episyrphus balteatus]
MKLQIVLLVLVVMALSASTEKSTGRRSNIRLEQLLRNQKDSSSNARFLWNKKQQAPASQIYVIQPGYTSYTSPNEQFTYEVTTNGTQTFSPVTSNSSRSFDDESVFDDDDEDKISFHNEEEARVEADDDEDDVQTSRRHQKQRTNLKLQKINARDQGYKLVIPAKYMRSIKKNAHASRSANFNNGVNKLRILRLNDKGHTKRKLSSN